MASIALVPFLIALFVRRSGGDIARAWPVLLGARPVWALAALAAQIATLALIAGKYRAILQGLGVEVARGPLARAHLRRHAVATLVPLGGPAGLLNFVRDLGRHRVSAATAVHASFLASVVNEVAFALFLAPTLAWLGLAGRLTPRMLAGTAALVVLGAGMIGGAALAARSPRVRARLLERAPKRLATAADGILAQGVTPGVVARAVPYALGVNVCGVAMLASALWAVGQHPSLATILAARVAASLTMLLIPVWQGAGATELAVLGALTAGGVPAPTAIAAIAVFRVAQFWFPLALGGIAFAPVPRIEASGWLRGAGIGAVTAGALLGIALVV